MFKKKVYSIILLFITNQLGVIMVIYRTHGWTVFKGVLM